MKLKTKKKKRAHGEACTCLHTHASPGEADADALLRRLQRLDEADWQRLSDPDFRPRVRSSDSSASWDSEETAPPLPLPQCGYSIITTTNYSN